MKTYIRPEKSTWNVILQRPLIDASSLETGVSAILKNVKKQGDAALNRYTLEFDKVVVDTLEVNWEEIALSIIELDNELKEAIQVAFKNIAKFHARQKQKPKIIETTPGVQCWQKSVGIERVGLYIPGGSAPLFSTVLMLGIPAKLADCREIIICSPPREDGSLDPAILYTAQLIGIPKIFKVGGAHAIAAMAYGTETIPKVDKIFGPGNQYVTAAKQLINKEGIAIDMPAGPSEVLVCADQSANPKFIAADLLSQAEHGADSQVILVTFEEKMVDLVKKELKKQLTALPRKAIAAKALESSVAIVVKKPEEALDIINTYAPEHLILSLENAEKFAEGVINAGSVFLGNYSPESVGDYASGTNHTLPTNGFAKAYSGVSLDSFVKKITFQKLSKEGLKNLGPAVEKMAEAEALHAHKNAVSIRLKSIKK